METTTQITVNHDVNVDHKEVKFNFKKDDLGNKRESILLIIGVPSLEGIAAILQSGDAKQQALLQEALLEVQVSQARSILNDNPNMTAEVFPLDQITWEAIANQPEAEKRGRGIPKEQWEDFQKDYVAVMPGITGKAVESVVLAAKLFLNRFNSVKTDKGVLGILKNQLAIYTNGSPTAELYTDVLTFLNNKLETLLAADNSVLAANL